MLLLLSMFYTAYGAEIREVEMIDELFSPVVQEEVQQRVQEESVKEVENPEVEISPKGKVEKITPIQEIKEIKKDLKQEIPAEKQETKEKKQEISQGGKENPKEKQKEISAGIEETYLAALVADRKGNIYYSKNMDKSLPMASVTKVMTLLVTFDAIRKGEANYQDKVTITKDVYNKGGSGISMKPGEVFTLIDLIRATAIYSANNAAYAIAKHIGKGSIPNFIQKMNQKAREIGVSKQISYYSPAGLPSRYTKESMDVGTARGIYKLSLYALKYPEYIEIAGIKQMKIHGGKINIRNRNHLIGENGIYGIKTGYHKEAKYNITVVSKQAGEDLLVVVLGGDSYKKRDDAVLYLLDKVRGSMKR